MYSLLGTVVDNPDAVDVDITRLRYLHSGFFGLVMKGELVAPIYAKHEGHHYNFLMPVAT